MQIKQKQPSEKLAYTFDFTAVISSGQTVSIIDSLTATNCGAVNGSSNVSTSNNVISGRMAQTTVDGGTDGESYILRCLVTDSEGQKHELDGLLEIIEL